MRSASAAARVRLVLADNCVPYRMIPAALMATPPSWLVPIPDVNVKAKTALDVLVAAIGADQQQAA